jgi:hypothetical protein
MRLPTYYCLRRTTNSLTFVGNAFYPWMLCLNMDSTWIFKPISLHQVDPAIANLVVTLTLEQCFAKKS